MTVLVPADPAQTKSVVRATRELPGPAYIRVGKGGNPDVPGLEGRFAFGRPEVVREGSQALLVACGSVVHEALRAADRLAVEGVSVAVAVLAHLPFAGNDTLAELLSSYPAVATVEDGFAVGGLGSLVAETIAGRGLRCRLAIRGVTTSFDSRSGGEGYMRGEAGLDAAGLAETVQSLVSA
jgi:transketolase